MGINYLVSELPKFIFSRFRICLAWMILCMEMADSKHSGYECTGGTTRTRGEKA